MQDFLVHMAMSVMPEIYSMLRGMNYSVLLCDNDGYILKSLGDPPFLDKSKRVFLSPGANWSEQKKGTNAIGTALAELAPVEVWGPEHYVRENHFLACWAAPVRGAGGRTVAVLDISGEARRGQRDHRLLSLALLGSKLLEQGLQIYALQQGMERLRGAVRVAAEAVRTGQITLDDSGIITRVAHPGWKVHGREAAEVIGQPVAEVFTTIKAFSFDQADSSTQEAMPEKMIFPSGPPPRPPGDTKAGAFTLKEKAVLLSGGLSGRVFEQAAKAAGSDSSVLILGESGTGKEVVARYLHECSPRRDGPFNAFSCSALPESLMESELFGYGDGAFTGSRRGGQAGKFELAEGGTIFLDEIGDMPVAKQPVLLRVLQEKEVWRIGEPRPRKVNVRIVAATNKDLQTLVNRGLFRLDLFYRLKVITIEVPPLRDRIEDILELVPFLVRKACGQMGKPPLDMADGVYGLLLAYSWPGNIRELENCIESMVAMSTGSVLTPADVPADIRAGLSVPSWEAEPYLRQQTRLTIIRALDQSQWKVAPAARLLGIGRNTLYRKIKEFGIVRPLVP